MALLYLVKDTATGKTKALSGAVSWEQETPTGTVNGSNMDFVLAFTPTATKAVFVYLDGLLIPQTLYSVNLGTKTVTFTTAPANGQKVYIVYNK